MLRALTIRHFAIIESQELDFEPGFTAITGETGAGKSILIDALGLLLGDRADSTLIAGNHDQAELSARFDLHGADEARAWLADQAMTEGDELIVRRVLSTQGNSRAWINGRSATIGQLAELGAFLVEIHGQHEHQLLERPDTQRRLLDQRVGDELVRAVAGRFVGWQAARQALEDFETEAGDPSQLELLRFQCRELDSMAMTSGEFEQLETEQERLSRSDEIRTNAARAALALDQDDGPSARALLVDAISAIRSISSLDDHLATIATMLEEARINVDEAISELERHSEDESDPERLDQINRRLEKALDLARKHRIQPTALPELTERLRARLDRLDNQDAKRQELLQDLAASEQAWRQAAGQLSTARIKAAESLGKEVNRHLAELGMDRARMNITVESNEQAKPGRHGHDRIGIDFSANPGLPLKPLSKVASGGELSRVSLALMIAARPRQGPLVRVFDEVDAGIGGETAHVVGRFLREAAGAGQAFCVTHLAQVAACAEHQFRVHKTTTGSTTGVEVRPLDTKQRQAEIARMLGSAESQKSLDHAAEMLDL